MSTTPPDTVERQVALRGRLCMAQNACATSLREVDALERQLLRLSVERATADEMFGGRCLAMVSSPKLSLSRRDHEREVAVLAAAAKKASTRIAGIACEMAVVDELLVFNHRLRRGRQAALEAAQWSERAEASSTPASQLPPECAFDLLLHESDERGLPATMLLVLELGLRNHLLGLLALAGTSRGLRRAVDAHVTERCAGINGHDLSARCEWPREPDDLGRGVQRALHYDDSVLSHAEPREEYLARGLVRCEAWIASNEPRARQARINHLDGILDLSDANSKVELAKMCEAKAKEEVSVEGGEDALRALSAAQNERSLAEDRVQHMQMFDSPSRNPAADTFRTHAKLRARIQLPLSLRALAVVLPHVARSLPLRWSLRLLGALAKVMDQLPKAPPQPLPLTLPMTLTR